MFQEVLGVSTAVSDYGTALLYAVLVAAAYTFAVALRAARAAPRLLRAARLGAYGTSALVLLGVILLSYAFVTHDFSIRYVTNYSDRQTEIWYLFTALWGGQDGSLLWWLFLLSLNVVACVWWLKGRYRHLQPYVIATLMLVMGFFALLMIFAANPFATHHTGAAVDGKGLNALLRSYWMIIHPPMLYLGFVACTVPFAFAVAALVTGRLDNEWIVAVRKWVLFAWLFLTIGNVLGMLWSYEELGWGGYWAWDPVENHSIMPWITASAYVHSTMIQERRAMLKIWNVVLICLTFLLTLLGTAMTRSGAIASVHAFAASNIGTYFVYFMALILALSIALIVRRLPELASRNHIEALASREAMFVINNWALIGLLVFVLISTERPWFSKLLYGEEVLFGPPHYNLWAPPIALVIYALMGLAPLFGWRKTSPEAFRRALRAPLLALGGVAIVHLLLGNWIGLPAYVTGDPPFPGVIGILFQKVQGTFPLLTVALSAFNIAVIVQEFVRGARARQASASRKGEAESLAVGLVRLVEKNRRRYGGYVVHLGIVAAFLGFVGNAWTLDRETSLDVNESVELGPYSLEYRGSYTCPGSPECSAAEEADRTRRLAVAKIDVSRSGEYLGTMRPAQGIYQDMTTSEVAIRRGLKEDLYLAVRSINPDNQRAMFEFHVNPLVLCIWIGALFMILGASISLWPEFEHRELGAWRYVRTAAAAATTVLLGLYFATSPSLAHASPMADIGPALRQDPTVLFLGEPLSRVSLAATLLLPLIGLLAGYGTRTTWFKRRPRHGTMGDE